MVCNRSGLRKVNNDAPAQDEGIGKPADVESDDLDKEHNRPVTVPKPATALLLLSGLLVTGLRGTSRHGGCYITGRQEIVVGLG